MTQADNCRVLIVGTGSIGERHTRCFLKIPGVAAAICEPDDDVRSAVAGRYPLEDAFAGYDAIDLTQFHTVVICTPAPLHIPMSIQALDAGCHVLCEKPLATSLDRLDELASAIERNQSIFRIAYTWRQHPAMQWIKAQLRQSGSSPVLSAVINTGQDFAFYRPAYRQVYYTRHETGGGAIQDAATHMIDLLGWWLGPARSVQCTADHLALEGVDVEDTVHLTLRFRNSPAIATLTLNQFQKNNDCRIELAAKDFTLRLDLTEARTGRYQNNDWTYHPIGPRQRDDSFVEQARAFFDAADGKLSNLATLDEAAGALRVTLAALQSAQTGKRIEITAAGGTGGEFS